MNVKRKINQLIIRPIRALLMYARSKWRLSKTYDYLMKHIRGYGGYTGADRKGITFNGYMKQLRMTKGM